MTSNYNSNTPLSDITEMVINRHVYNIDRGQNSVNSSLLGRKPIQLNEAVHGSNFQINLGRKFDAVTTISLPTTAAASIHPSFSTKRKTTTSEVIDEGVSQNIEFSSSSDDDAFECGSESEIDDDNEATVEGSSLTIANLPQG
ncbi:hypothetical protein TSUD_131920 [Trifolium subterraneum]|uniref:Uncharacterized protein n=1 Tax=Trifolium subterraneum TaxID=3900 RepID=A0A2Z6LGR7_TRISU|nr:hypothetical protein TSUD_131920 [Trifolium subterraneum]